MDALIDQLFSLSPPTTPEGWLVAILVIVIAGRPPAPPASPHSEPCCDQGRAPRRVYLVFTTLLLVGLTACATIEDLERLEARLLTALDLTAGEPLQAAATGEKGEAQREGVRQAFAEARADIQDRRETVLEGLSGAPGGIGLSSVLAILALRRWRRTREAAGRAAEPRRI